MVYSLIVSWIIVALAGSPSPTSGGFAELWDTSRVSGRDLPVIRAACDFDLRKHGEDCYAPYFADVEIRVTVFTNEPQRAFVGFDTRHDKWAHPPKEIYRNFSVSKTSLVVTEDTATKQ
jgi:hypothetical protein